MALPRTVFFGSPAFAVPSLERIAADADLVAVVTQPDRPAGRGQALTESPVKQAASRIASRVPILQPEKIRIGEFEVALRALAPELFVVVAYGRILPAALLNIPRLGPWNVHASSLPRLRGAAPIQWAVINGDSRAGVSIMRMEAGLDTGPVAATDSLDILDDDTAGTLAARLSVRGANLLGATLPRIVNGTVNVERQDDSQATLAPILRKEDGRLDFSQSAVKVSARARGVDPWPGATAMRAGEHLKLFGPRVLAPGAGVASNGVAPGTVLQIDGAGLQVACGDGCVAFFEVQLPGRRRLPAAVAAAGRGISVGDKLG
jgi:methionyl-tRNA formyltransferase